MMQFKKILILTCGLSATLAFAQPEYDLSHLETLAMESSRSIMAARDQVTAARYAVDSASAFPNPESEQSLLWNDAALAIDWPLTGEPQLSAKDMAGKPLNQAVLFD